MYDSIISRSTFPSRGANCQRQKSRLTLIPTCTFFDIPNLQRSVHVPRLYLASIGANLYYQICAQTPHRPLLYSPLSSQLPHQETSMSDLCLGTRTLIIADHAHCPYTPQMTLSRLLYICAHVYSQFHFRTSRRTTSPRPLIPFMGVHPQFVTFINCQCNLLEASYRKAADLVGGLFCCVASCAISELLLCPPSRTWHHLATSRALSQLHAPAPRRCTASADKLLVVVRNSLVFPPPKYFFENVHKMDTLCVLPQRQTMRVVWNENIR